MTTKTENLTAWEALMLLMEGVVLHDRLGCKWTDKALSRDSHGLSTTIAFLIDCAPFRLAEPKKTAHEANELIKALDCITDETRPLDCVDIAEKIYAAIHQEARKIAQEEIAKLRKEIGYQSFKIPTDYFKPPYILTSIKGQDRGEPNE